MTTRAIALLVSLSLAGCSTTSTIHRAYGPAYETEIVDSDASTLRVLGDDGRLHAVPREEVTDIDHPGNVLFTIGAVLVGVAAIVAFSTPDGSNLSQQQQEHDRETATAVSLVYGVPGLAMLIAGGVTYFSSKSKASAFESGRFPTLSRPPQVRSIPPPAPPRLLAPPPPAPAPAQPAPAPSPPADEPEVIPAPPAESPR